MSTLAYIMQCTSSGRENLTSVTPENYVLFALSLTSNMKKEAIKRMKDVNADYLENE
jgi:hypothetical protein